ncbi:MAG: hypothetical protein LBV04_04040 [Deferribacteraceae bacterium]|jgi:NAD kinase|nr:hypothetical protein [Deferribacteraceae bacterium]
MKSSERRVVIVTRDTRFENILAKENTVSQARFKMKSLNAVSQSFSKTQESYTEFDIYEQEHKVYQLAIQDVRERVASFAPLQMLNRRYLPNFVFADSDIVVCIGQDGLVANTMKYLSGQPVIGVNPDKSAYDGVLLPFTPKDAFTIVREVLQDKRKSRAVSMGEVRLPDGQSLLAVNDFFIGQKSHVSARYIIKHAGVREPQSSSGIIISTGLGSTGWMKSVLAGARGVNAAVLGSPYGMVQNEELIEDDIIHKEPALIGKAMVQRSASMIDDYESEDYELPAYLRKQVEEDEEEFFAYDSLEVAPAAEPVATISRAPALKKATIARKKEFGMSDLASVVGQWESKELLFAVREPFPSKTSGTSLVFGKIGEGESLRVESMMGENGIIFSDGIESDFLEFNSGTEASIGIAKKTGRIII